MRDGAATGDAGFELLVDLNAVSANHRVVDDTSHPLGHWDNILGRLEFYPTAPCRIEYQQNGKHPIHFDWPTP